jgi:hypothetical protein
MEITFKEIEIVKLDLKPGDILLVKVKSDDIDESVLDHLKKGLKSALPGIKVALFGMSLLDDMDFSIVREDSVECGTQSYCTDCSCGKKEQNEAKGEENV